MYSLGTYTREIDVVLWASISFASLRAISTGCTCDEKVRLKTPSTRFSSLCSRLRRTLIVHSPRCGPDRSGPCDSRTRAGARRRNPRGVQRQAWAAPAWRRAGEHRRRRATGGTRRARPRGPRRRSPAGRRPGRRRRRRRARPRYAADHSSAPSRAIATCRAASKRSERRGARPRTGPCPSSARGLREPGERHALEAGRGLEVERRSRRRADSTSPSAPSDGAGGGRAAERGRRRRAGPRWRETAPSHTISGAASDRGGAGAEPRRARGRHGSPVASGRTGGRRAPRTRRPGRGIARSSAEPQASERRPASGVGVEAGVDRRRQLVGAARGGAIEAAAAGCRARARSAPGCERRAGFSPAQHS